MRTLAVNVACWLLKLPLSIAHRTKLTGAILDGLNAVPLRDVITFQQDGTLLIDGMEVDYEKAIKLRESARAMRDNQARQLVRDQISVIAGTRGVVQGDTPEKLYFYRAALWAMQSEQELYNQLAGDESVL
jgi:hypothetical protein